MPERMQDGIGTGGGRRTGKVAQSNDRVDHEGDEASGWRDQGQSGQDGHDPGAHGAGPSQDVTKIGQGGQGDAVIDKAPAFGDGIVAPGLDGMK